MATKKKARGRRGSDVVRVDKYKYDLRKWYWERYSPNHEYICGSWPETFKRKIDCIKSAKRAMTPCEIVEET